MNKIQINKSPQEFGLPRLENLDVEEWTSQLPILEIEAVTHIGSLQTNKQVNGNFEGFLLSVSVHPEEWEEIARLGGCPWFEISAPRNLRFLNRWNKPKVWKAFQRWGVTKGLLQKQTWWKVPSTDESGNERFSLYQDRDEAKAEEEEEDCGAIQKTKVLVACPELQAFWNQRSPHKKLSPWMGIDMLTAFLGASAYENEIQTPPDGIWWEETYNPTELSAPRGGLFPRRLLQKDIQIQCLQPA